MAGSGTNFLSLPAELRNYIYDLALSKPPKLPVALHSTAFFREPALLRASKQVRLEAGGLYYASRRFTITITNTTQQLKPALDWIRHIVRFCGKDALSEVLLYITERSNRFLNKMVPLAGLAAQTGLQIAAIHNKHGITIFRKEGFTIFVQQQSWSGSMRLAVEQLLGVGMKAADEGWSMTELEKECRGLLDEREVKKGPVAGRHFEVPGQVYWPMGRR